MNKLILMTGAIIVCLNLSTAWAGKCIGTKNGSSFSGTIEGTTISCRPCGDGCDWEYDANTHTLYISGNGTMNNFDNGSRYFDQRAPWHDYLSEIESVTFDSNSTISNIGTDAFSGATSLTSVDIPNVKTIGKIAFDGATSLTSIDMPNVTSIGNSAFSGATSLTSVYMPNLETIGQNAFYGASALTNIDIPNIKSIGYAAFYQQRNLSYVGLNEDWQIDASGYFLDENGERILLPYDYSTTCGLYGGKWNGGDNKCYAVLGEYAFSGTGISTCGRPGGSCGTCTGYLVSGRGCVTSETCGTTPHYYWSDNACNRIPDTTENCSTTDFYYNNGSKCVKRESPTSPMTCATGYSLAGDTCAKDCTEDEYRQGSGCVSKSEGCSENYLLEDKTCVSKEVGCSSGFLNKDDKNCVEPSACTGEYIVDSENGLCKKMPGCLNYADGACGGCENGFYKKEGGCVSSEEGCGSGYLEKDSVCISSVNGCGAGYKNMGGYCNRVRYTPAEAAPLLNDDNNTVTITFRK